MVSASGEFFRVSGGGNDFIALIDPPTRPSSERVRSWCTRGLSLGADGLFVLERTDAGSRMRHFNADGQPAELCLNGTRCAVRLSHHLGWHEGETTIDTDAGPIRGSVLGETVRLEVPLAGEPPRPSTLRVDGQDYAGWSLSVGVPQFVLVWPDSLNAAPVASLGPQLRAHPDLSHAGTNVMFVRFLPPSAIEIRSFERGVEAETLACGTGVLAAAAVAVAEGLLEPPLTALTGGGCEFEVNRETEGSAWTLTGDARLLARLEPTAEAERIPRPPVWS